MARSRKPQPKAPAAKPLKTSSKKPAAVKAANKTPKVKPPSKSALWDMFVRRVNAAAKELNLPQEYKLTKVREKGGKRGEAWKDFERAIAQLFREKGFLKAERVSRGDDLGESDIDVDVPEIPVCKVDTKYQIDGWSVFTLFQDVEKKYVTAAEDFLVMPLKGGPMSGNKGSVSVIRSEKLVELLAHVYLREAGKGHAMSCPFCPGAMYAKPMSNELAECICRMCGTAVFTAASKIPKGAWLVPDVSGARAARKASKAATITTSPTPMTPSAPAPAGKTKRKTA